MGFFNRKSGGPVVPDNKDAARPGSDETTPAPSGAPSVLEKLDFEKAEPEAADPEKTEAEVDANVTVKSTESQIQSRSDSHDNALERRISGIEKDVEEQEEEGVEYPKKMQLALITTALCLSVFCMALDNTIISTAVCISFG